MATSTKLGDLYVLFRQQGKEVLARDIDTTAGLISSFREGTLKNTQAVNEAFKRMGDSLASQFLKQRLEQIGQLVKSGALSVSQAEGLIGQSISQAQTKHEASAGAIAKSQKAMAEAAKKAADENLHASEKIKAGNLVLLGTYL